MLAVTVGCFVWCFLPLLLQHLVVCYQESKRHHSSLTFEFWVKWREWRLRSPR